jgi:hypothetical protein
MATKTSGMAKVEEGIRWMSSDGLELKPCWPMFEGEETGSILFPGAPTVKNNLQGHPGDPKPEEKGFVGAVHCHSSKKFGVLGVTISNGIASAKCALSSP